MPHHRFRITLRRLMIWIAAAAVVFALLRSPFWLPTLLTGPSLLGFAFGRTRGATGIVEAMFAGAIGCEAMMVAVGIAHDPVMSVWDELQSPRIYFWTLAFGLAGLFYGAIVGGFALVVLCITDRTVNPVSPPIDSIGPIQSRRLAEFTKGAPR